MYKTIKWSTTDIDRETTRCKIGEYIREISDIYFSPYNSYIRGRGTQGKVTQQSKNKSGIVFLENIEKFRRREYIRIVWKEFSRLVKVSSWSLKKYICNCAADFSLLNLPKGKSLGRSKPPTSSYAQAPQHTVWDDFYYIQALLNCLL